MRQVPHYLIIGNGRVARHFKHYFSQLNISHSCWHRLDSISDLNNKISQASHILLLITDHVIEQFITEYLFNSTAYILHFSGSLVSSKAFGVHPLMTFSHELYSLEQYQQIPFVVDHDAPLFDVLLPGLSNKNVRLQKTLKTKYHALCVMAGNFSCLLWQKLFSEFEDELKIPPEVAFPYLLQQSQNLVSNHKSALTGPLVRGDVQTIENNLVALHSDPFQKIYQSFIACYEELKQKGVA